MQPVNHQHDKLHSAKWSLPAIGVIAHLILQQDLHTKDCSLVGKNLGVRHSLSTFTCVTKQLSEVVFGLGAVGGKGGLLQGAQLPCQLQP